MRLVLYMRLMRFSMRYAPIAVMLKQLLRKLDTRYINQLNCQFLVQYIYSVFDHVIVQQHTPEITLT